MPTVKTIKPGGGGDYTTLQAWEDWADGEATADQWAECYTGGDCGNCLLSGWASTPTASVYPKIYAASGHEFVGDISSGAYMGRLAGGGSPVNYLRVENMRVLGSTSTNSIPGEHCTIDSCYLTTQGASTLSGLVVASLNDNTIKNCIFSDCSGPYILNSSSNTTYIYNNTIVSDSYGLTLRVSGTPPTVLLYNNIIHGDTACIYEYSGSTSGDNTTSDNNCITDAILTSMGIVGSNDLESQSLASVLTDAANDDFTLAASSPAIDAGADLSGTVDTDVAGTARPQNSVYDIGAFEVEVPTPVISTIKPGGGGDYTTLQAWEDWADGEANAYQWAECYSGGDLGACNMSGWTSTPTASVYPRIYAADGHRWDGDPGATAAYTTSYINLSNVKYVEVDGLITLNVGISTGKATIKNCYMGDATTGLTVYLGLSPNDDHLIYNNVIANCTTTGIRIITSGDGDANFGSILNNTICNCNIGVYFRSEGSYPDADEVENFNVTLKNNISVGNSTADYATYSFGFDTPAPSFNITNDSNLSSDTSLTTIGATTNALQSKSTASVLTDAANDDFTLAASSPAIDAGADLSGTVDTDVAGTARPQNSVYDIGAFENAVITYVWDGASANWSTTGNWSGSTEPDSSADVTFDDTSTQDCTIDGASDCNTLTITSGYTGTITCTNGLTIQGAISLNGVTYEAVGGSITLGDGVKITANGLVDGGTITVTGD